ncbi:MAG: AbrB/MazE/SpoVT family DNA-binding domain-containing protein [Acidianus sp.]|jgi:looped-hinge helix DNA binding domain, AbrB family
MKVKVTRNFQIAIPAKVREKLDIKEGDLVDITKD